MSVASRLVRNSVFPGLGRLWVSGIAFIILPFMKHSMGGEAFGVLQDLLMFGIFFSYADAGFTVALPKYVAEYAARGEAEELQATVNTGLAYYLAMAVVGVPVLLALGGYLLRLNSVSLVNNPSAMHAYYWAIACGGIVFVAVALRGILIGLQRADVINAVEVSVSVPVLIVTVWVLATGKGLMGMIIVQFVQYAVISAAIAYYAVKLLPSGRINPFHPTLRSFRQLLNYGWRIEFPAGALMAQGMIERTLLSNILGPASVGNYAFGSKLIDAVKGFFYPALSAIVPAASHLEAVNQTENLRHLYERGTKVILGIACPISGWLFAIAPIFATVWMGSSSSPKDQQTVSASIRFLAICGATQLTAGVCMSVARGLARLKPDLIASPLLVVAELGLGIWLGREFHFAGIMSAGVIAFAVNTMVSIVLVHRGFEWPLAPAVVRQYVPPIFVAAMVAAPLVWINGAHISQILMMNTLKQRVVLAGYGVIETVIYGVVYVGIMWLAKYISPTDLQSLSRASRGLRKAEA